MLDYHLRQSQKYIKKNKVGSRWRKPIPLIFLALTSICLVCGFHSFDLGNSHRNSKYKHLTGNCLVNAKIAYFGFVYIFKGSKKGIEHEEFIVFLPVQDENKRHVIVQEIICPKDAELCFKIEDYQLSRQEKHFAKFQRRMMVETVDEVVLSVSDLVPNPGEAFSGRNAMGWSILKTRLVLPYSKGIVAQMFATGCIQLDSKKPSRTLMIGLGGAGIPNFLGELEGNHQIVSVELEPAVEYIAHKWFALEKSSSKQRVIVQDGLEFINNWQPSFGNFDCIIVDACTNKMDTGTKSSGKYPMICPIADFVNNEEIVKKMFGMLKATGTLLVNTFALQDEKINAEVAEERQFILELFRHHFGNCYYADVEHYNLILVCSLSLSKNEKMTTQIFESRMKQLPKWLQNELGTYVKIMDQMWTKKRTEI